MIFKARNNKKIYMNLKIRILSINQDKNYKFNKKLKIYSKMSNLINSFNYIASRNFLFYFWAHGPTGL